MILRNLKTKTIEAATPAALDTAIATFIAALGEQTFVSIHYQAMDATHYSVLIAYTE